MPEYRSNKTMHHLNKRTSIAAPSASTSRRDGRGLGATQHHPRATSRDAQAELQASEATKDEARIRLQEHEDLLDKMSARSRELEESLEEAKRLSYDLSEQAIKIDKTDPKNCGAIEAINQGRRLPVALGMASSHSADAVEKMLHRHNRPGDATLAAEFVTNLSLVGGLLSITGTSAMQFPNSIVP